MMTSFRRALLTSSALIALSLGFAPTVQALTFSFSGSIECQSKSTPPASCSDALGLVGDTFTGSLTVNTAVADSNGNVKIGQYNGAVTALSLVFGSPTSYNASASGGSVTIWDDYCAFASCPGAPPTNGPYQDKYEIPSFSGVSSSLAGYSIAIQMLLLQEPSQSLPIGLVTTDSLNQIPVVISDVNNRYFQIDYWASTAGATCVAAGTNCNKLRFVISNWTTSVPEPGSLALLGLGLVGLGLSRRRKAA